MLPLLLWACSLGAPEPAVEQAPKKAELSLPSPTGPGEARMLTAGLSGSAKLIEAEQLLEQVVRTHTSNPENPWAIGHGLVALGPGLMLSNQESAVDWLFSSYAERFPVGDSWLVRFPESKGKIRIEPHPNLILKALADAGVDPERAVTVQGQSHTVGDLYRGALAETHFDKRSGERSFPSTNELPWTLSGIASWSSEGTEWTDQAGRKTSLNDLTDHAWMRLSTETNFLSTAMAKGESFSKRGQGIFTFTCGGAHLIQGVSHARALGFGHKSMDGPFSHQLKLLAFRFPIEMAQIDNGRKTHPQFRDQLLVQRLKLAGHTLETFARLAASSHQSAPTAADLKAYADEVAESVGLLKSAGVFKRLNELQASNEQLYLDIVGDSAHALRGIRIATGGAPVYY